MAGHGGARAGAGRPRDAPTKSRLAADERRLAQAELAERRMSLIKLGIDARVASFATLIGVLVDHQGAVSDQVRAAAALLGATNDLQPPPPLNVLLAETEDGKPDVGALVRSRLAAIKARSHRQDSSADEPMPPGPHHPRTGLPIALRRTGRPIRHLRNPVRPWR